MGTQAFKGNMNTIEKLNFLFNSIFGYYIMTTNQRTIEEFTVHMVAAIIIIVFMYLTVTKLSNHQVKL